MLKWSKSTLFFHFGSLHDRYKIQNMFYSWKIIIYHVLLPDFWRPQVTFTLYYNQRALCTRYGAPTCHVRGSKKFCEIYCLQGFQSVPIGDRK